MTTSEPVRITNSLCMGLLPTPIQQRVPQLREHVSSSCLLIWSSCLETQTQKTESSYFQILLRWLFTHLQYSILSFQLSLLIILASTVCEAEVKKWSKDKMFPSHLKAGLTSVQHGWSTWTTSFQKVPGTDTTSSPLIERLCNPQLLNKAFPLQSFTLYRI